jgi:hypothetical protein
MNNNKGSSGVGIILINILIWCFLFTGVDSMADIIPYGNGAWVYDASYSSDGTKGPVIPGLFVSDINTYNTKIAKSEGNRINQLFVYGGDIENEAVRKTLKYNDFSTIYYYPVQSLGKNKSWTDSENIFLQKGASGFRSTQAYTPKKQFFYGKNTSPLVLDNTGIEGVHYKILVIDGRVDKGGYLQGLNIMTEPESRGLARKVARIICADSSIDGVQFDIEPFSFSGEKGGKKGSGQKFFYQELAKCFAGWYAKKYKNVHGINKLGAKYDSSADLIGAVSRKHPNGRFFSVFTFADSVTDEVIDVYKKFGNFYVIDSLYDLEDVPGAKKPTTPESYKKLVQDEIDNMKEKKIPYQFAIPAAASCHEFESCNGIKNTSINSQLDYIEIVMKEINPGKLKKEDNNFKGIAIWSWNSAMWWNGNKLEPSKPGKNVLKFLGKYLE